MFMSAKERPNIMLMAVIAVGAIAQGIAGRRKPATPQAVAKMNAAIVSDMFLHATPDNSPSSSMKSQP